MTAVPVKRRFVSLDEGDVHVRTAGPTTGASVPLVMFHASPGSSKQLEPLIEVMAATRPVIAPDTLGNGDSAPPAIGQPEIEYFADAHRRTLDAMGVACFDAYGTHTGANMAIELAIRYPLRVRRLILDGVSLYSDAERADMLAHHAPPITIDDKGAYLDWIWHFVRDAYLFWPWYKRDAANTRNVGLPAADVLYEKVLEVVKAARTYHLSYNAAIRYPKAARLSMLSVPTLLACAKSDMLITYLDAIAKLVPGGRSIVTSGIGASQSRIATAAAFTAFLDEHHPDTP